MAEVFRPTGFFSYWFEQVMKDHVFNYQSKMNVDLSKILPHKEKYRRKWNGFYGNQPNSVHYLNFEKKINPSRSEYIRCFTYYFSRNSGKWNVHHIHEDNFRLAQEMEAKYQDIESTFRNDFNIILKKSKTINKPIKDMMFCNNGFPEIFKMYFRSEITLFSIIIFNKLFGVFNKLNTKSMGIIEDNKLNNLRVIFDDVYEFVYRDDINWKEIFKMHMKSL